MCQWCNILGDVEHSIMYVVNNTERETLRATVHGGESGEGLYNAGRTRKKVFFFIIQRISCRESAYSRWRCAPLTLVAIRQ